MYYYCGGGWSTALLNCGTGYNSASLNSQWVTNVRSFLQDVAASGIFKITITSQIWGGYDGNIPYCTDGTNTCGELNGQYNFIVNSREPGLNDGLRYAQVHEECLNTTIPVFFWPSAPYAVRVHTSNPASPTGPWMKGYNNAYNCSPKNPYFVGWGHIEQVWNALLQAASLAGLTVHQFEPANEINLAEQTVELRLLYDNKHGDTGNPASIDVIGYYMGLYGYDYRRIVYSTLEASPSQAGFDCGSFYGDTARLLGLSELTSATAAGLIGLPPVSRDRGLYCGGSVTSDMVSQPRYYPQPRIVNAHVYNVNGAADVALTFTGVKNILNSYGPSGWRYYDPILYNAEVMIGETHSGVVNPDAPGKSCELGDPVPNPSALPNSVIGGFNQSSLANTNTTVFRPWLNLIHPCYRNVFPGTVNPPYSPTP